MTSVSEQLPARARTRFSSALRYTLIAATISAGVVLAPCPHAFAQGGAAAPKTEASPAATAPVFAQQGGWGPPPGGPPSGYGPPPGYGAPQAYPQEDLGKARVDGERDANADTSGILWFGAGCALGAIGIVLGFVIDPSPPAARLMGKSPEYVAAYSASYKSAGKSAQGKLAIYGCATTTLVVLAIYIIIIATAVKAVNDCTHNTYGCAAGP